MSSSQTGSITTPRQRLSTETIVLIGLLGAVAIFLGVTRLGSIPLPNLSGNATIVHVPTILAGVLGGPLAGAFVGLIWGGTDWITASIPLWADPLVSIVPRLFVGPMAYLAWRAFKNRNAIFALGFAGWVGTVTNTVLVLSVAVARKYIPLEAIPTIMPQAIAEQILAIIVTIAIGAAFLKIRRRPAGSRRR
jgi:uncharacterized membrane protein